MLTGASWSESATVLQKLQSNYRRLSPFDANQITEVQGATTPSQWRYVPTVDSLPDLVSWGCNVAELVSGNIWWQGVDFLLQS